MSVVAVWVSAELLEGRVEVGNRVRFKSRDGEARGVVCETERRGRERPRAVVRGKDGTHAVQFENVAPGAAQKTPRRGSAAA